MLITENKRKNKETSNIMCHFLVTKNKFFNKTLQEVVYFNIVKEQRNGF